MDFTPIGWQGAAQHTWTQACDGLHAPGPCTTMVPIRIPAGITVNGALIALMQDSDDDPVTAELRINGPPVP